MLHKMFTLLALIAFIASAWNLPALRAGARSAFTTARRALAPDYLPHRRAQCGGFITLLDTQEIKAGSGYNIVEENVRLHPEFNIIPADTISTTEMELTVRTDLPGVSFSNPNRGVGSSKSGYITRLFQSAYLDAFIQIDVRLLQNRTADAAGRYMEAEQSGFIESAMRTACRPILVRREKRRPRFCRAHRPDDQRRRACHRSAARTTPARAARTIAPPSSLSASARRKCQSALRKTASPLL